VQFALTVPYGQDRLIPIWVATLALRQKSRTDKFRTVAEMLAFFKLAPDGYHYERIVQSFKRIFAATILFGTEDQPDGDSVIDWARFHFFDEMHLWFSAKGLETLTPIQNCENSITLSEAFYREIDQYRIPVEREVVAHAPGILDFYLWIVWKSWAVTGQAVFVPLTGPIGLAQQLGTRAYSRKRRFRQTILAWLRQVKAFWPNCPATISADGHVLVVGSSRNSPAIRRGGRI
jgi:hypothetical protein